MEITMTTPDPSTLVSVKIPHLTAKGVAPDRIQPMMEFKELARDEARYQEWLDLIRNNKPHKSHDQKQNASRRPD